MGIGNLDREILQGDILSIFGIVMMEMIFVPVRSLLIKFLHRVIQTIVAEREAVLAADDESGVVIALHGDEAVLRIAFLVTEHVLRDIGILGDEDQEFAIIHGDAVLLVVEEERRVEAATHTVAVFAVQFLEELVDTGIQPLLLDIGILGDFLLQALLREDQNLLDNSLGVVDLVGVGEETDPRLAFHEIALVVLLGKARNGEILVDLAGDLIIVVSALGELVQVLQDGSQGLFSTAHRNFVLSFDRLVRHRDMGFVHPAETVSADPAVAVADGLHLRKIDGSHIQRLLRQGAGESLVLVAGFGGHLLHGRIHGLQMQDQFVDLALAVAVGEGLEESILDLRDLVVEILAGILLQDGDRLGDVFLLAALALGKLETADRFQGLVDFLGAALLVLILLVRVGVVFPELENVLLRLILDLLEELDGIGQAKFHHEGFRLVPHLEQGGILGLVEAFDLAILGGFRLEALERILNLVFTQAFALQLLPVHGLDVVILGKDLFNDLVLDGGKRLEERAGGLDVLVAEQFTVEGDRLVFRLLIGGDTPEIVIGQAVFKQILLQTEVHIVLELLLRLSEGDIAHRHQESLRTQVVQVVHVVVHVGVERHAAFAFMHIVEHLGGVRIHRVADVRTVVRLAVDRDQIIERVVTLVAVDEVVVLQECKAVENLVPLGIVAHRLDALDLLEDREGIEGVLLLRAVLVDVELGHVHRQHQMRITVADGALVLHVHIIQDIVDDAAAGTAVGGADDPVENGVLLTAGVLHAVQVLDGGLQLLLELGEAPGEGETGLHAESASAELQRLIRNLGGYIIGAGLDNPLVDEGLVIGLGLLEDGMRVALGKADQVRGGIDERRDTVLERIAVEFVVPVDVTLVRIEEQETILLIHDGQTGTGSARRRLVIDLFLDVGDRVHASSTQSDEDVFVVLCHKDVGLDCF